jgi:1-acyl-sn-glycerol-3-phosphate acyltransferase
LSESSQSIAPRRRRAEDAQTEAFVLPLWAINVLRRILGGLSRLFWRISFKGLENIPQTGGVIIAANHQTYIDPIWMSLLFRREIRYLAMSESFSWPVIGKIILMLGAWPIQVEKADKTMLRRTLQWLRGGGAIVIFPEGGRCLPDGHLLRFKPGAVRMALEANVPILPITIKGGHRVWPKGYRLPHLAKVELTFHPLQYITMQEGEDSRTCARRETDQLADTINSAL